MIKFIYEREGNDFPHASVKSIEMKIDDSAPLDHMFTHFAEFLKSVGYHFNGELELSDEDSE